MARLLIKLLLELGLFPPAKVHEKSKKETCIIFLLEVNLYKNVGCHCYTLPYNEFLSSHVFLVRRYLTSSLFTV